MAEMGHTDPALALKVYAQAMRRDESQQAQLRALLEGADWANMGERAQNPLLTRRTQHRKTPICRHKRP
jgi:hypothetical protein